MDPDIQREELRRAFRGGQRPVHRGNRIPEGNLSFLVVAFAVQVEIHIPGVPGHVRDLPLPRLFLPGEVQVLQVRHRHGKADVLAVIAAGGRDADDFSGIVKQAAAAASVGGRRGELDEPEVPALIGLGERAEVAEGHRSVETPRASDGHHRLAPLQFRFRIQLQRPVPDPVRELQERDVMLRVHRLDLLDEVLVVIVVPDPQECRAFDVDHMVVCDKQVLLKAHKPAGAGQGFKIPVVHFHIEQRLGCAVEGVIVLPEGIPRPVRAALGESAGRKAQHKYQECDQQMLFHVPSGLLRMRRRRRCVNPS